LVLSALLTDETFATMEGYYRSTKRPQIAHWAFLGSCLSMYLNWNAWTLIAAFAGREMQGLAGTGLEFSVYAAFIGMVVPRLREKPAAIAALVAAIVAVVAVALPYKINITLAAVLGVLAATIAGERMRAGAST
jgi:predicted branched-subunit amino acid permease